MQSTLNNINEGIWAAAENTAKTNEKLDVIKGDTEKSSRSKIPLYSLIVAVIALAVTVSGLSVASIYDRWKAGAEFQTASNVETEVDAETESETERETAAKETEYTMYLHSEYNPVELYVETEMTATLDFETDAVSITAYLASGEENTLPLERKNATEWQKKVQFTETGVHKVVVTAKTPDGKTVENSIEVEVIPLNIDMDTIKQFLPTGL